MGETGRRRLDIVLCEQGLARSRSEARDLILRGLVTAEGRAARKAGELVAGSAVLALSAAAGGRVSRAAVKLEAALDAFGLSPAGRTCLDIGASTGGFTQTLLARGARHVTTVDVGRDQLHAGLRGDPRVLVLEGRDARSLTAADVAEPPSVLVADVSFISLRLVLPVPLSLLAPLAWLVVLVKPQFELGPDALGKGGIVKDKTLTAAVPGRIAAWLAEQGGWSVLGTMPSPLTGKGGNTEYLLAARLGSDPLTSGV